MSGKKESDVQPQLEKAEEFIREQIKTIQDNSTQLESFGFLNGLQGDLSKEEKVIQAKGEAESRSLIQESRDLFDRGAALDAEAERLTQNAMRKIDEVRNEINSIKQDISRKKREQAGRDWYLDDEFKAAQRTKCKAGEALKECKAAFAKKREALDFHKKARSKLTQASAKQKEEAAKAAARDFLKNTMDEIGHEDVDQLEKWTRGGNTYRETIKALTAVESLIAAGRCEEAEAEISRLTAVVRDMKDLMQDNMAKSKMQLMKAKAVIQALKDMNYDEPDYYYDKDLSSGDGDPTSDLIVYAANPGGGSDIRLTISLENKMGLEMFRHDGDGNEIAVSQEDGIKCHKAIEELQGRMAKEGYEMNMTNWGQAVKVENSGGSKQRVKEEVKQKMRGR